MPGSTSLAGILQPLAVQLAVFLALLLGASGVHKLASWRRSRAVVERFGGVPAALALPMLCAVVGAELAAPCLLIVPATRDIGAMLAALLLSAYWLLIVRAIAQNRRNIDCGCSFGASSPLGAFQVARNAILVVAAGFVAVEAAGGGSGAPEWSQVLGAIALLSIYGALDQVMSLQPLRGGEVL